MTATAKMTDEEYLISRGWFFDGLLWQHERYNAEKMTAGWAMDAALRLEAHFISGGAA